MGGRDEPQPAFRSSCCLVAYLPVEWFSRSCSCCCCFFFARYLAFSTSLIELGQMRFEPFGKTCASTLRKIGLA